MKISVIIPTLNEEHHLSRTLSMLRREHPYEIIVADGGSTDQSLDIAQQADHLVQCDRGRARQMNQGAQKASGDALIFLHADCCLTQGAFLAVKRCLARRSVIAGCFQMQVDASGVLYRMIDACASIRVKLTGIIYGDQGLFLRRDIFEQIGGFPNVRFMEDVKISLLLRQLGRTKVLNHTITVSARRWQKQGILRQTFRNWTLTALAAMGIHPDRLAGYYPQVR